MFFNETKKKAYDQHKKAVDQYDGAYGSFEADCERLYQTRIRAFELIERIEAFLNSISRRPHQFKPLLKRITIERKKFRQPVEYAAQAKKGAWILGGRAAGGVAGGAAMAKLVPPALILAVAKIGKTAKGIPISKLWGVARTNAIKARLGGGAKAIGGGGIKAGQAVLDAAGPAGMVVAGIVIAVSLLVHVIENKKAEEQAVKEAEEAQKKEAALKDARAAVSHLYAETEGLLGQVGELYQSLEPLKDSNYARLSKEEQLQLGTLVNQTLALAEMLNKVVAGSAEAEE